MPQVVGLLGRSWAVGTDDFALLCPASAASHICWVALASLRASRTGVWRLGAPLWLWDLDVVLCACAALADVVITGAASQGSAFESERRTWVLPLLRVRAALAACLFVVAMGLAAVAFEEGVEVWDGVVARPMGAPPADGWVLNWVPGEYLCWLLVVALLGAQLLSHCLAVAVGWLLSEPGYAGTTVARSVYVVLRVFGASDRAVSDITEVLLQLLGDVDLVPTDIMFGLALVGLRQRLEGRGGPAAGTTTPLQPESAGDQAALRDLRRLAPFAHGIYGCGLGALGEAAYKGTSLIHPLKALTACCRAVMPCSQGLGLASLPCWFYRRVVEGDNCLFTSSYPLRHLVAKGGGNFELLWATWESHGVDSAPPFALVLDHAAHELIVTIRGTFSVKDCIIDARCTPEHFNPLGMSSKMGGAGADGGPESEHFAHAGMLSCMRDIRERIVQRGILDEVLATGGKAHGYRVVCTGHSLGAGIAALLALALRARLGDGVRYVGFNPPGCVVSPALAEEIERHLGWYSLVLAQDWISRMSLRSLQFLREEVLDELMCNRHSKLWLAVLLSRRELAYLPRQGWPPCLRPLFLGWRCPWSRGRDAAEPELSHGADVESGQARELGHSWTAPITLLPRSAAFDHGGMAARLARARRGRREEVDFYAVATRCPGRRLVLRPTANERLLCGLYSRTTAWSASWWQQTDGLDEVLVSRRAIESHFPFVVEAALRAATDGLAADVERASNIDPAACGGPR